MTSESLIGIITFVVTSGFSLIAWFCKKLINDMETKVKENQFQLARAQDHLESSLKENILKLEKILGETNQEIRSIRGLSTEVQKNVELLQQALKNQEDRSKERDELAKEKIQNIQKMQDKLNDLVHKLYLIEQKLAVTYGAVIKKD
jgi:predicted  nucleic acid-binding Zn-ribbon protein